MRVAIMLCAAATLLPFASVSAQDARLTQRFAPATARVLDGIISEAVANGAPPEPLIQKALEGAAKNAPPELVADAVRALANRLEIARRQLGNGDEAELVAAASALYVGTDPAVLARLRALRPDASLAMPLVALTFFVRRGVTTELSERWIESLVERAVPPDELLRLQQSIDADIREGALAATAGETRVRALILRHGGQR